MVSRSPQRWILGAALLLGAALPAMGQATLGAKLRVFETLMRDGEQTWGLFTLGEARVALQGATDTVKAELAVDALLSAGLVPSLARAWVAARFPGFRITLGKTPLAWGEGVAFNAGDLVFGAAGSAPLDLTGETLRDDAAWMAVVWVPLGRFSFVEALAIPPELDLAAWAADPTLPLPPVSDTSAALRLVSRVAGINVEPAYLWRGSTGTHTASLTLQGNLVVDWNLSASTAIGTGNPAVSDLADALSISAGLFHLQRLGPTLTLSMRLETLVAPARDWVEVEAPLGPTYGILLYPELTLSVERALSISLRSVISPVDGSALLVPSLSLGLQPGLSWLFLASVALGDETDTYSTRRAGGLSFLVGAAASW